MRTRSPRDPRPALAALGITAAGILFGLSLDRGLERVWEHEEGGARISVDAIVALPPLWWPDGDAYLVTVEGAERTWRKLLVSARHPGESLDVIDGALLIRDHDAIWRAHRLDDGREVPLSPIARLELALDPMHPDWQSVGDGSLWVKGRALIRRRAGGASRVVFEDRLLAWMPHAIAHRGRVIAILQRETEWDPGTPRRAVLERVGRAELHAHDETVVLALDRDDRIAWLVAGSGRAFAWDVEGGTLRLHVSRIRSGRFTGCSTVIDLATGAVSRTENACGVAECPE